MKTLLLILSLVVVLHSTGCTSLPRPNLHPAVPSVRVVTYNINWGAPDPRQVVAWLLEADADIICLQETHRQWEDYLKEQLAAVYPHSSFHDSGGAGGIAFMSKQPLKNVRVLKATAGWFPALVADVTTDLGPIQVLNVHLRPPLSDSGSATLSAYYQSPEIHRKEIADFLSATNANAPVIIAGDFNENENREAVKELLCKGYTDALSLFDTKSKTWSWKVFPGLTLKNRYDHIVFNRHLICTGALVVDVRASDHRPVLAVLIRSKELPEDLPAAGGSVSDAPVD